MRGHKNMEEESEPKYTLCERFGRENLHTIIEHDGDEKYIFAIVAMNSRVEPYLISLPLESHDAILVEAEKRLTAECHDRGCFVYAHGGGMLKIDHTQKTIQTYGKSMEFGKPHRKWVEEILENAYPDYTLDIRVTDEIRHGRKQATDE